LAVSVEVNSKQKYYKKEHFDLYLVIDQNIIALGKRHSGTDYLAENAFVNGVRSASNFFHCSLAEELMGWRTCSELGVFIVRLVL
jgi:hypothetical protein